VPWHFLHREEEIGFFPPHLKQILKNSLRCCAICFFVASVIGMILYPSSGKFLLFYFGRETQDIYESIITSIPDNTTIIAEDTVLFNN
jgi:hypothetical protein